MKTAPHAKNKLFVSYNVKLFRNSFEVQKTFHRLIIAISPSLYTIFFPAPKPTNKPGFSMWLWLDIARNATSLRLLMTHLHRSSLLLTPDSFIGSVLNTSNEYSYFQFIQLTFPTSFWLLVPCFSSCRLLLLRHLDGNPFTLLTPPP
jgi:hypothetical protein